MFILSEAKANQAKGNIMSAELFGIKLLVKFRYRTLMKIGWTELVQKILHIPLLQYVILFILISAVIKPIPLKIY
jgi:hypothetical protein